MGKKCILVTFGGPTQSIPEGGQHCFSCDGDGRWTQDRRKKCKVCRGKGYWNREDMLLYHKDCTEKSCHGTIYGCTVKHSYESEDKLKRLIKEQESRQAKKKGKE